MPHDYVYEPENSQALAKPGDVKRGDVVAIRETQSPEPVSLRDATFAKSGTKPLLAKQAKVLRAPIDEEEEADILPTGEIYMSHVYVRRRLNDAVGPMGWALRPISMPDTKSVAGTMYREFALIVLGRVVATAFGSQKYYVKSDRMDFADVAESVKSNALTRCCKDLGIGSECWDRRFIERWKDKFAVHVWVVEERWQGEPGHKKKVKENAARWRRIDARPFPHEFDIVRDSPNQESWRKQWAAWIAMLDAEAERSRETAKKVRDAKRNVHEARKEEQAVRPEQPAQQPQGEQSRSGGTQQTGAQQHQASSQIAKEDRRFRIRECKVIDKQPSYTLHKIVMFDGTEFLTFSTRVYASMQGVMAAGKRVAITPEMEMVKGKPVAHVKEWRIEGENITHSAKHHDHDEQDQRRADDREPGQEG
jgi:hypothetical protein